MFNNYDNISVLNFCISLINVKGMRARARYGEKSYLHHDMVALNSQCFKEILPRVNLPKV